MQVWGREITQKWLSVLGPKRSVELVAFVDWVCVYNEMQGD